MSFDGKLLARARTRLEERRAANAAERRRRIEKIYREIPRVADVDAGLARQMKELVGATIRGGEELAAHIARLEEESLALQAERAELLVGAGYPMDYLSEIHTCKTCSDSGYVNGRVCECLHELYNRELTAELGVLLKTGDESFERFNLSYYDAAPDENGDCPRDYMAEVLSTCRDYAAAFTPKSPNLLFTGETGLGKTYLSACIARVVADKGFSVCYDSASSALDAFENRKFSRDAASAGLYEAKVARMLDCDLMILDDLGTEMLTQMSMSALYTLINTRLVNHRAMIISTNLTDADLERRYTPQINSRLDGEFFKLVFVGRDIRKIKKEREA